VSVLRLKGLPTGQVIAGGWLSVTITLIKQFDVNPDASVAVQVMIVVPLGR
jgi:hypothetical protein